MGPPLPAEPSSPPEPEERLEISIIEARNSRERRCSECGKRTARWKPVRRQGTPVVLCEDCATKPTATSADATNCPSCGAVLRPEDRFCGRCGLRIEYACPACAATLEGEDAFCGRCGTRVV